MQCTACLKNNIRRDANDTGLCWQHRRTKCRLCGELSAGKHYCTNCEHSEEIQRWKAESRAPWLDQDHDTWQIRLRRERLFEAKYHQHRATEIHFRALALMLEAVWGGVKTPEDIVKRSEAIKRVEDDQGEEFKKAA